MKTIIALFAAATALFASAANAQITVKDPWVRATVPQQKATGAFMQLQSPVPARLVSANSPLTPDVEIHEMSMEGDVMRMRQVQAIELPAGQSVALKPGGYHIMFLNLTKQVREGDTVPVTLMIETRDGKRTPVQVSAPVRGLAAGGHGHK
ncbi:copper chaperone PCu(A)C [Massilia sp. G4R7]|uniref:Copper chaperone PCu(A)C n=1 Tax=Massilia phyllostachyos TaxID=2898585 RepID=A0ABS8Q0U9_9BURK|nr:copper chaperone PCu(A)C [Massilia phyllostachyos]MCD2515374.1 copper chaperone PCu(A)C [Massilia phyllostachyos]